MKTIIYEIQWIYKRDDFEDAHVVEPQQKDLTTE